MKAVLMSIRPEWVELICEKVAEENGKPVYKKRAEIRKTKPNRELPVRVLIYCTKDGLVIYGNGKQYVTDSCEFLKGSAVEAFENSSGFYKWNGKVIGEFVCDRIDRIGKRGINNNFDYCYLSLNEWGNDDVEIEITDIQKSCISKSELNAYGANSSCLYAWHISDLKIYDKPKELSEFRKPCPYTDGTYCIENKCEYYGDWTGVCRCWVERPPQSWCYVEE